MLASQNSLPEWITQSNFIKKFNKGVRQSYAVQMGDYMVVLVHVQELESVDSKWSSKEIATFFAVNLQDDSVQEAKMDNHRFAHHRNYTLKKYKENQIIQYGSTKYQEQTDKIDLITIESFEPFQVSFKEISMKENMPNLSQKISYIYQDCLYAYGYPKQFSGSQHRQLWSFNLENRTWKLCETTGNAPGSFSDSLNFVHKDNLYIYEKESPEVKMGMVITNFWTTGKSIYVLNLTSMEWMTLEQNRGFIEQRGLSGGINGVIYYDNLLFLANILTNKPSSDVAKQAILCCWNITTNSWTTYKIKDAGLFFDFDIFNLMIYQDVLLLYGPRHNQLSLSMLDLTEFDLPIPRSSEEERLESLFLNEQESDFSFKVQDKSLPAHKEVLIQKSRYFANLFNSGMIESRQDTIDMPDCDYDTFREFLRWIYCDTVQLNEDRAMKLLPFADKYLEKDLRNTCFSFLTQNMTTENVFRIMDFASQQYDAELWDLGFSFLRKNSNKCNIRELIEFLERPHDLEFAKGIPELKGTIFQSVIQQYGEICQNESSNLQLFQDFLIKSININTVLLFSNFIRWDWYRKYMPQQTLEMLTEETFEQSTANLKKALFNFVNDNIEEIKARNISKDFSESFWTDLVQFMKENEWKK